MGGLTFLAGLACFVAAGVIEGCQRAKLDRARASFRVKTDRQIQIENAVIKSMVDCNGKSTLLRLIEDKANVAPSFYNKVLIKEWCEKEGIEYVD